MGTQLKRISHTPYRGSILSPIPQNLVWTLTDGDPKSGGFISRLTGLLKCTPQKKTKIMTITTWCFNLSVNSCTVYSEKQKLSYAFHICLALQYRKLLID